MSVRIRVGGAAKTAVDHHVPPLVANKIASSITRLDPSLWGKKAEAEAAIRLGWTEAVSLSRTLVSSIKKLREELQAVGVNRFVLAGMGGSSLAPEVITRTAGVELTILDSTAPSYVCSVLKDRLEKTAVVVSSKSGSTLETDSQLRLYAKTFQENGIDPRERIIVVTDPGSPFEIAAKEAGYRIFTADPTVGGRYSALTAFGLVPSGLAGVDISELLDEAEAISLYLASDTEDNPGLILGAAIAGTSPLKNKLGIVADGTHVVGFADWAEQLLAESTGKSGTGILPVVLETTAAELQENLPDMQILRIVNDADQHHLFSKNKHENEILISGSLGGQILTWEYAVAVAGYLLKINPFDQPDVESAKVAARALLTERPEATPAIFCTPEGIEVRGSFSVTKNARTLADALKNLFEELPLDGYISIQAYLDRLRYPELPSLRNKLAVRTGRPVTFGWGPRFLHSTGQFHKGGPAIGAFLQITETDTTDLAIPERPFSFGSLIRAQADGDAAVLQAQGRPVLRINLTSPIHHLTNIFDSVN